MAESVCTGDCLDVDENGRIIVVPDSRTIVCESDGNGGMHLVAKTIDCDPWPLTCSPEIAGNRVYCDNDLLYVEKPYFRMDRQAKDNLTPDLVARLNSPTGTVVAENFFDIANTDPCNRNLCARVWMNWNKYAIVLGPGGRYEFNYQYSTDGGVNWTTISDSFFTNDFAVTHTDHARGTTNHVVNFSLAPGETKNVRMRIITGPAHDPTSNFTGTQPFSVYSFYADWLLRSDCD